MDTPANASDTARHRLIDALELTGDIEIAALDRIARVAAYGTRSPVALVTFVGADRQWIPGRVGWADSFTALVDAFCSRAVTGTALLEVRQPHLDDRFKSSRLVTGPSAIRFYAGHPIVFQGVPLGTVCILDRKSRALSAEERAFLADLAGISSEMLAGRKYEISSRISNAPDA